MKYVWLVNSIVWMISAFIVTFADPPNVDIVLVCIAMSFWFLAPYALEVYKEGQKK